MLSRTSRELLERPGLWSAGEALALLRRGAEVPSEAVTAAHQALVSWIRRNEESRDGLGEADIDDLYEGVRVGGDGESVFRSGTVAMDHLGYGQLAKLVGSWSRSRFLGIGCPWEAGLPRAGDRVLDLGCGSGVDVAIAGAHVGSSGFAWGIDRRETLFPPAPWDPNQWFSVADAEWTSVPDRWAEIVVANGLPPLLSPTSSAAALLEASRVLAADGSLRSIVIAADCAGRGDDETLIAARRSGKPLLRELKACYASAGLNIRDVRVLPSPYLPGSEPAGVQAVLLVAAPGGN